MKKIAMLLADGYEEGESLFVVDILRRAGFQADIVSTTGRMVVEGAQHIKAEADRLLEADVENYDMIVLPGGQQFVPLPWCSILRALRLAEH